MKSLKTLLSISIAFAFSSPAFAETLPTTPIKEVAKQQITQTKQAVETVKKSAKLENQSQISHLKSKLSTKAEQVESTVSTIKEKVKTTPNTETRKHAATARETLNSAKQSVKTNVKKTTKTTKININTATFDELQALEGIGEVKAKAIIEYRQKNGEFKKITDLTKVNGIGASTISKLRSNISLK